MKGFLLKSLAFSLLVLLLIIIAVLIVSKGLDIKRIPGNNISNSSSFRAKIDHAVRGNHLDGCSFLISGSSMSLNNISGKVIHDRTGLEVYNISSFGTKPRQTIEMIKHGIISDNNDFLLVAFNNCDFGDHNSISVDYEATEDLIKGSLLKRIWVFAKTFNLAIFFSDLDEQTKYSELENNYKSLKFDSFGSVLLERSGFRVDSARWREYYDTTGFVVFHKDIRELDSICNERGVEFFLIYLPFRQDLVDDFLEEQNSAVADNLRQLLGYNFINLSRVEIPPGDYCDYAHMFREGAEQITTMALNYIQGKNTQQTEEGILTDNLITPEQKCQNSR